MFARKTRLILGLLAGAGALTLAPVAHAHISIPSSYGPPNTSQEIGFLVAHGCGSVSDVKSVTVQIPAGAKSVRPLSTEFGPAVVNKDAGGTINSVTWTRPDVTSPDADVYYYKLSLRLTTPDAPFTALYFVSTLVCRNGDVVVYDITPDNPTPTSPDGGADHDPAPTLYLVPAHQPGWNKLTLAVDIPDLSVYFKDALIVWKGTAAYSINPVTTGLISTTSGVTPLTSLKSGDQISVKY